MKLQQPNQPASDHIGDAGGDGIVVSSAAPQPDSIALKPFQKDILAQVRGAFSQTNRRVCLVLPTGAGKTVIATKIIQQLRNNGHQILFAVHREELVDQANRTMRAVGLTPSLITSGKLAQLGMSPVQICTVQTMISRVKRMQHYQRRPQRPPSFVIWDEAHHIAANTWKRLVQQFDDWQDGGLWQLGLTATPIRSDGKGLKPFFDRLVEGPDTAELIRLGELAPYRLISTDTEFKRLRKEIRRSGADFIQKDQSAVVGGRIDAICGETLVLYRKYLDGRQAIFFAVDVAHSKRQAEEFCRAGISAVHIDGKMDSYTRRKAVRRFRMGDAKVLCNHAIVNEGFDVPEAEGIIIAKHVMSLGYFWQAIGRVLRFRPGKIATIIDQGANWQSLPLPHQGYRWTLANDSEQKGGGSREHAAVAMNGLKACGSCDYQGFVYTPDGCCPRCGAAMVLPTSVVNAAVDIKEILAIKSEIQQKEAVAAEKGGKISDLPAKTPSVLVNSRLARLYAAYEKTGDWEELRRKIEELAGELNYKPGWADFRLRRFATQKGRTAEYWAGRRR